MTPISSSPRPSHAGGPRWPMCSGSSPLRLMPRTRTTPLPLAALSLTPPADLALLAGFNATARALPGGLLPDLLSDRAAERGPAAAVVFGDASLSYAELEARSNALARHLIGLGVGPDAVVAIALPRSFEMVVALLAVLKAGGAYLPLDPDYPQDRLRFMLEDSRANVLISRSDVLEELGLDAAAEAGQRRTPVRAIGRRRSSASMRRASRKRSRTTHRPDRRCRAAPAAAPRSPRLCHLYLRIHRQAKGCRQYPRGVINLSRALSNGDSTSAPTTRVIAFTTRSLRHRGLGTLWYPAGGRTDASLLRGRDTRSPEALNPPAQSRRSPSCRPAAYALADCWIRC